MPSSSKAQADWVRSERGLKALGEAKQREWIEADEKAGFGHLPHRAPGVGSGGSKRRHKTLGDLNFTSHLGRK